MTDLRVDTASLRDAAAQLRAAREFAETARERGGRLRGLAPSAGGAAARAAEDFLREWSYGLGLLGDDAETLATVLDSAAAAFEAVESQLTEGLR